MLIKGKTCLNNVRKIYKSWAKCYWIKMSCCTLFAKWLQLCCYEEFCSHSTFRSSSQLFSILQCVHFNLNAQSFVLREPVTCRIYFRFVYGQCAVFVGIYVQISCAPCGGAGLRTKSFTITRCNDFLFAGHQG